MGTAGKVLLGLGIGILTCSGLVTCTTVGWFNRTQSRIRASEPYRLARGKLADCTPCAAELGSPIRIGTVVGTTMQDKTGNEMAFGVAQLTGPKGRGTIAYTAEKKDGAWRLDGIQVQARGGKVVLTEGKTATGGARTARR